MTSTLQEEILRKTIRVAPPRVSLACAKALLLLTATLSVQAENLTSRITEATTSACSRGYAAPVLAPLRGKMPMTVLSNPTAEMRADEIVPTAKERAALPAYFAAESACSRLWVADFLREAGSTQQLPKPVGRFEEELLLQGGKISYAEYFRRRDRRVEAGVEDAMKTHGLTNHAFQDWVETWLTPFKPNYSTDSPWWNFYNFAIERARDADAGKISQKEAQDLIESRRLKVNEEMAAQTAASLVNLNCEMTAGPGQTRDMALVMDYPNKQVNRFPATFTETTVTWSSGSAGNGTYNYQLNRLSGFLNVGTEQFPALSTGRCAPAKRKF